MRFLKSTRALLLGLAITAAAFTGANAGLPKGLNDDAMAELSDAGVDKYLGEFTPVVSTDIGGGWTKHTFDPDGGNGPICIAGTPFSVFTRAGDPKKLLIFEQGGGACWQDFYNCNVFSESQEPPAPPAGIWNFGSKDNVFDKYSIVYMPYCDGSVFSGDNTVFDPAWQAFIEGQLDLPPGSGPPVRSHRGLRNQSAGMDVAADTFPNAQKVVVAGSSAGGVGAAGFAPFLARFQYGNDVKLHVFNDAGPVTTNLDATDEIAARAADWQFGQFYPASCTDCSDMGQSTAIIQWRLDNDTNITEAFYETDADLTNRFFMDLLADPAGFRDLIVTEHGLINAAHPDRYKRFIVAGDTSHTALQTLLFNIQSADGVFLDDWTSDFLKNQPGWVDIVEDPAP